eukprot:7733754-Alexandrium_andersonii.AAC.1
MSSTSNNPLYAYSAHPCPCSCRPSKLLLPHYPVAGLGAVQPHRPAFRTSLADSPLRRSARTVPHPHH